MPIRMQNSSKHVIVCFSEEWRYVVVLSMYNCALCVDRHVLFVYLVYINFFMKLLFFFADLPTQILNAKIQATTIQKGMA